MPISKELEALFDFYNTYHRSIWYYEKIDDRDYQSLLLEERAEKKEDRLLGHRLKEIWENAENKAFFLGVLGKIFRIQEFPALESNTADSELVNSNSFINLSANLFHFKPEGSPLHLPVGPFELDRDKTRLTVDQITKLTPLIYGRPARTTLYHLVQIIAKTEEHFRTSTASQQAQAATGVHSTSRKVTVYPRRQHSPADNNTVSIFAPKWVEEQLQHLAPALIGTVITDGQGNPIRTITAPITPKDLVMLTRIETYNVDGVIKHAQYTNISPPIVRSLRDLVREVVIVGGAFAASYGGYGSKTTTLSPKPIVLVCDLSGLQFQRPENTGRLFLIPSNPSAFIENQGERSTDAAIFKALTGEDQRVGYYEAQADRSGRYVFVPNFWGQQQYLDTTAYINSIANDFEKAAITLNAQAESLDIHNLCFKFLQQGTGFFSDDYLSGKRLGTSHLNDYIGKGILAGLRKLMANNIDNIKNIKALELPFFPEGQLNDDILKQINAICVELGIHFFGRTNLDALAPREGYTTATTNCGDPHACAGNEMGSNSVDAIIGENLACKANSFSVFANPGMSTKPLPQPASKPAPAMMAPAPLSMSAVPAAPTPPAANPAATLPAAASAVIQPASAVSTPTLTLEGYPASKKLRFSTALVDLINDSANKKTTELTLETLSEGKKISYAGHRQKSNFAELDFESQFCMNLRMLFGDGFRPGFIVKGRTCVTQEFIEITLSDRPSFSMEDVMGFLQKQVRTYLPEFKGDVIDTPIRPNASIPVPENLKIKKDKMPNPDVIPTAPVSSVPPSSVPMSTVTTPPAAVAAPTSAQTQRAMPAATAANPSNVFFSLMPAPALTHFSAAVPARPALHQPAPAVSHQSPSTITFVPGGFLKFNMRFVHAVADLIERNKEYSDKRLQDCPDFDSLEPVNKFCVDLSIILNFRALDWRNLFQHRVANADFFAFRLLLDDPKKYLDTFMRPTLSNLLSQDIQLVYETAAAPAMMAAPPPAMSASAPQAWPTQPSEELNPMDVLIDKETAALIIDKFLQASSISQHKALDNSDRARPIVLLTALQGLLNSQNYWSSKFYQDHQSCVVTVHNATERALLISFIGGIQAESLTLIITADQARRIYTHYGVDYLSDDQAKITLFNQNYRGRAPEKVAFVLSQYCRTPGSESCFAPYPVKALTNRSGYTLTANSIFEHQQLTKFLDALPEYPKDTAPPPYTVATDTQQVSIPDNITIIEARLQNIVSHQWLPTVASSLSSSLLSFFQKPNLTFGSSIDRESSSIRLFFKDADVAKKIFEKIGGYFHGGLTGKDHFNTLENNPNDFLREIRLSFDECKRLVDEVNQTSSFTKR